jgi:hypothetical protein
MMTENRDLLQQFDELLAERELVWSFVQRLCSANISNQCAHPDCALGMCLVSCCPVLKAMKGDN